MQRPSYTAWGRLINGKRSMEHRPTAVMPMNPPLKPESGGVIRLRPVHPKLRQTGQNNFVKKPALHTSPQHQCPQTKVPLIYQSQGTAVQRCQLRTGRPRTLRKPPLLSHTRLVWRVLRTLSRRHLHPSPPTRTFSLRIHHPRRAQIWKTNQWRSNSANPNTRMNTTRTFPSASSKA